MSAYSGSGESVRAEKNGSFLGKISSKISNFWADLTSDGSDDVSDIIGEDEFLEEDFVEEFYEEQPVKAVSRKEEVRAEERTYSQESAAAEKTETYGRKTESVYGSKAQENAPEFHDDEEIDMSSDVETEVEDEVDFEITPQIIRSDIQFTGTYTDRLSAQHQQQPRTSIGFELPKNSAAGTTPSGAQSGTTAPVGFNGGTQSNHSSAIIQFFEPHETKQADEICSVLKAGAIVIVNLQNVKEENDKLRIIDFVSGCCKGIDAKVQMVASKSIFVAAPKGIELRKPVVPSDPTGEMAGDGTGNSAIFSGFNFGVPGSDRSTNSFIPKF